MTLGLAPQTGRLAQQTLTPIMSRILAVTQPELYGRLRDHQQDICESTECTGGNETDTSAEASGKHESHEVTDKEVSSTSEGDMSVREESRPESPTSTSDDSSGESAAMVATESDNAESISTTHRSVPTISPTTTSAFRAHRAVKGRVAFTPGTAAPVSPAVLSVEAVDLLRQLCVGQTALLNTYQDQDKKLGQVLAFMEGIHSDVGGLHRTLQGLSSTVTAAIQLSRPQSPAPVPSTSTLPVATPVEGVDTTEP
ncbi:uncharacterized protein LOC144767658 [Lissotriton helveticus]